MMSELIRSLSAVAAGLTALNVFLLSYPGDLVPQSVLLAVGGVTVFCSAVAAMLSKPVE